MITYENTKTIYDLVEHAGRDYDNRVFLRYEENDMVFDISYRQFMGECHAIAAWTKNRMHPSATKHRWVCWEAAVIIIWL